MQYRVSPRRVVPSIHAPCSPVWRAFVQYQDQSSAPSLRDRLPKIFLVALLIVWMMNLSDSVQATSLSDPKHEYLIDVWEAAEGLPEDTPTAMVQTPDGYLWFGTFNGLVRFDGVKFTVFDRSNTPQLPSPEIINLYLDHTGRLWISTALGMASVRDGQWRVYKEGSGWIGDYVRFFAESASGQLYVTDFDGKVLRFRGDGFEELPPPPADPKLGFLPYVDDHDVLWEVTPKFIGRFVNGKWQKVIAAEALLKQEQGGTPPWIMAGKSRDGGLWIATSQHLRKYKAGNLVFETLPPWPMPGLWSLNEDAEGNVWICSWNSGLFRFSPDGKWRHFTTQSGLSHYFVRFVFLDREGNWWLGTSSGGLERFKRRKFMNWGLAEGLPGQSIKSVTADRDGGIIIGMMGEGVARLKGTKISQLVRPGETKGTATFALSTLIDHSKRLWVGTLADGLFVLDHVPRQDAPAGSRPPRPIPAARDTVYGLFEDSHENIWIGTNGGAIRFDGKQFKSYPMEGAPKMGSIRCFAEDPRSETLWACSQGSGLYRLAGEQFARVPEAQELASEPVTALLVEKDGTLWIGTEDTGLACLRNGHLTRISEKQGLPGRSIASILDDGLGYFWFGANRGILRISRSELEAVIGGQKSTAAFQVFNRSDGLASVESSNGFGQPAAVKDPEGKLWFASFKGVVGVDPRNLTTAAQPPPLVIEEVDLDGQPVSAREQFLTAAAALPLSITVPPGAHRLEFHYAGLSLTAPEKLRFRYMVEGLDKSWIDLGGRRAIYLQDLKPGRYRLRVDASNNGSPWSETSASAEFSWKPHFYQTQWFLGLSVLGVVFAGMSAFRLRVRRVRVRELQLEKQVHERTAELESQIAERVRADAALKEQQAFLRQVIDINPSFIFAKDRAGRFTLVNKALAEAYNTTVDAVIGKTDADFAPRAAEAEAFRRDDLEVLDRLKEKLIPEEPITDAAGHLRWLQTVKRPLLGEDGKARQLLGVATDVTARKLAEDELRRREEEYRRLIEDIPEVVWKTDEQGDPIFISKKIEDVFGYSVDEVCLEGHKLWFGRIHPDDRERVREAYAKVFTENRPFDVEYRIQHRDGHWMWWHDRAVFAEREGRRYADGLLSDITLRKQAEEGLRRYQERLEEKVTARTGELATANKALEADVRERQRVEEELRRSEDKFAKAFHSSPAAMSIGSLDTGQVIDVNEAFLNLFGFSREEVIGRTATELRTWTDSPAREAVVATLRDQGPIRNLEARFKTKTGKLFDALFSAEMITFGGSECLLAVTLDVTEQKRLEEQLRQSQKMDALGQLAGGVAHDFNNLLEVIMGYGEILADTKELGAPQKAQLGEVQKAAERAAALTRQLLAFSRKQMLQATVLDLNAVVAEVEKLLQRVIGEKIELNVKTDSSLGRVRADRGQIEQVILNLSVNARDAMPAGGKLTIETANVELDQAYARTHADATPGSYVMLAVSDTGKGMDAATRAHIFEPFFTTKERGKGTGLGLSTVYGIVKQSGGHIWLYSEPGRGTTFKIYFPRVAQAASLAEPLRAASNLSGGSETILVVEDEEAVRKLECEALTRCGYRVLQAQNAEQALALSQQHPEPIHILVTDMVMPGKGGHELACELLRARPELKVLYLSGYTENQVVLLEGQNDAAFLQKPFTLITLARKVRELLDAETGKGRTRFARK